jgi:hypothetical protein
MSRPHDHRAAGSITWMKNTKDGIGSRNRDLSACGVISFSRCRFKFSFAYDLPDFVCLRFVIMFLSQCNINAEKSRHGWHLTPLHMRHSRFLISAKKPIVLDRNYRSCPQFFEATTGTVPRPGHDFPLQRSPVISTSNRHVFRSSHSSWNGTEIPLRRR